MNNANSLIINTHFKKWVAFNNINASVSGNYTRNIFLNNEQRRKKKTTV